MRHCLVYQLLKILYTSGICNVSKHVTISKISWIVLHEIEAILRHTLRHYKLRLLLVDISLLKLALEIHVKLIHEMLWMTLLIDIVVPIHIHLLIHWVFLWSYNP